MKFTSSCLAVVALLPSAHAFAPTQPAARTNTVVLDGHKDAEGWLGPAAATVAGWTLAAQVAFANPMVVADQPGKLHFTLLTNHSGRKDLVAIRRLLFLLGIADPISNMLMFSSFLISPLFS